MVDSGATAAFCPTSNLFLGSGLFDLAGALDSGMRVGVATDVGGGTSFSMLRTLGESIQSGAAAGLHDCHLCRLSIWPRLGNA